MGGSLQSNLVHLESKSKKIAEKSERFRARSVKILQKQQAKIYNKEKNSVKMQKSINKSLINIKHLWHTSMKDMKKSLKFSEIRKSQIKAKVLQLNKDITDELFEATNFPNFDKQNFSDKDLVLHETAFSYMTDTPEIKNQFGVSSIHEHSQHSSNYSLEFEKCMAELDCQKLNNESCINVSIDKSIGG